MLGRDRDRGQEGLGLVMVVADVRNDKKYPDKGDSSAGALLR
jgi:hypothetical protein